MAGRAERERFVFAFTSHGFGHLSRTLRVLDAFLTRYPDVDATVCARAPRSFIDRRLSRAVDVREVDYEPGTAQKNCFEVDVGATIEAYRRFDSERPARLRDEERFLRSSGCRGLVADIPALPIRAARQVGVPSVGLSNFTWDWILEPLLDASLVETVRADYGCGDLLLGLPLGPGTGPFATVEAAPLVGPTDAKTRHETLETCGISPDDDRPLVLVCIGGWSATEWSPIRVSGCENLRFVMVGDLPIETRARAVRLEDDIVVGVDVCDLVAASDAVLTKPGYGICSECLVHRTPMVGIERRGFRESTVLVAAMEGAGRFRGLSLEDFFAGDWEDALSAVLGDDRDWTPWPTDGAEKVALRIGRHFGIEPLAAASSRPYE